MTKTEARNWLKRTHITPAVNQLIAEYYTKHDPPKQHPEHRTRTQLRQEILRELEPHIQAMASVLAQPRPNLDTT